MTIEQAAAGPAPGRSQAAPHPLGGSGAVPGERGADIHDVAIVGFGPSGAVAAALLGQAGLRVCVLDRQHEVYDKPRAIALDHEILRVFQQLGIVEQVDPVGNEAAFAKACILEALVQRCAAAATSAMAHDENFRDFKLCDSKFECC